MEASLAARLILAATFAVAGVAKLADLGGSRSAVAGFGVPAALVGPLATILPVTELIVAMALLPSATARAGATGALVLLLLLSVAIARSDAPDCHCFGQLRSAPAGRRALARNFALALLAGLVLTAN